MRSRIRAVLVAVWFVGVPLPTLAAVRTAVYYQFPVIPVELSLDNRGKLQLAFKTHVSGVLGTLGVKAMAENGSSVRLTVVVDGQKRTFQLQQGEFRFNAGAGLSLDRIEGNGTQNIIVYATKSRTPAPQVVYRNRLTPRDPGPSQTSFDKLSRDYSSARETIKQQDRQIQKYEVRIGQLEEKIIVLRVQRTKAYAAVRDYRQQATDRGERLRDLEQRNAALQAENDRLGRLASSTRSTAAHAPVQTQQANWREERPISYTITEERPISYTITEERPISYTITEERPISYTITEERPISYTITEESSGWRDITPVDHPDPQRFSNQSRPSSTQGWRDITPKSDDEPCSCQPVAEANSFPAPARFVVYPQTDRASSRNLVTYQGSSVRTGTWNYSTTSVSGIRQTYNTNRYGYGVILSGGYESH